MVKRKILIADDDQDFIKLLFARLSASGYDVICAYDGMSVLDKVRNERPDLLILDWKMPSGKGSAVLESLSEGIHEKSIPVIVLSGLALEGLEERATQLGAKAMFRKPYDGKELVSTVRKLLGEE